MLNSSKLQLCRKFLILAVLSFGLYFSLTAGQKTFAQFCSPPDYMNCCCYQCNDYWDQCNQANGCYLLPQPDQNTCIYACFDSLSMCFQHCDGLC